VNIFAELVRSCNISLSLSLYTSLSFSGEEAAKPWMASSGDNLLLSKTQDRLKTHTLFSLSPSLDVQP